MKKIILLILLQFTTLMAITFNVTAGGEIVLVTDTPPVQEAPPVQETPPDQGALHELGTGTTYYIDTINGRDTNDGLSENNAWQSISKVSSSVFSPGDNILFKKGQIFISEKQLSIKNAGTINSPILFGSYGVGAKPILTSVTDHKLAWVDQGNNIWRSTTTFAIHPERLKRNGAEILRAQYMSELGTKVPALIEWRYENTYIYLYSLTDPNQNTFSYSNIPDTISSTNVSNIVLQQLNVQGGYRFGIRLGTGDNLKLIDMTIGSMSGEGFRYSGGNNLLIDGCNFDADWSESLDYTNIPGTSATDSSTRGIQEATTMTGAASNIIIRNSIFKNWMHASISVAPSGTYTGMKIYNNHFSAPDLAYGGKNSFSYDVNNIEYYNNTHEKMYSGRTQHPSMTGNNAHYHHNIFRNMWISPMKDSPNWGFSISHNENSSNVIIEDNVIINSAPGAIKICGGSGKIIRRNTLIDSSHDTGYGAIVLCKNTYGVTNTTIIDNNIYDSSTQNNAVWYKNRSYTMSEFNTLQYTDGDIVSGNYSSSTYSLDGVGCNFIP